MRTLTKITKIVVLLAAVFFLYACNPCSMDEEVQTFKVIPESEKEAATAWILEVVSAANPYSDEEPEDNIKQAEKTAIKLFGVQTIGILISNSCSYHEFIPYENCNRRQKKLIARWRDVGYE